MEKGRDVVLVTGATGQQGGAVARQLLSRGHKVRALTRKPQGEAAKALAGMGAEVVPGDLDDVGSLEKALRGAWGVFTRDLVGRRDAFRVATIAALAPFYNPGPYAPD